MKRTRKARPFAEPALLAALGVLVPMLDCLPRYSVEEFGGLVAATMPGLLLELRPHRLKSEEG